MTASGMTPALACPQCRQIDAVSKVSALVDAGISMSRMTSSVSGVGYSVGGGLGVYGGQMTVTGGSQSLLSQRLSPPAMPQAEANGWDGMTLAGVIFFGFGALVSLVLSVNFFSNGDSAVGAVLLVFWVVFVGCVAACFLSANSKAKSRQALAYSGLPRWNYAYGRWQQLYYCGRCDGVFLPGGQTPLIPASQMLALLYAGAPVPLQAGKPQP